MATLTAEKKSEGTMFWADGVLDAYKLAKNFGGERGSVATMPDVIAAKATADSHGPLWTNYFTTTSGEFYGRSKGGVPIVVVTHGIDDILQNREIMERSMRDLRENSKIQLTPEEFHKLEDGAFGPTNIVELSTVVNMRQYPTSVLSYGAACDEDPLLLARLGTDSKQLYEDSAALKFLRKHREITMDESGNAFIITNDHTYPYRPQENTGGLVSMTLLSNCMRCGGEPSSVSTQIDVSDLASAGRFIALSEKGVLGEVSGGLEEVFRDFAGNWEKLTVPYSGEVQDVFTLKKKGGEMFAMYPKEGARMDTGIPQFHVKSLKPVPGPKSLRTSIGGYHGFVKYDLSEMVAIMPEGANAFLKGEPSLIMKDGNPDQHEIPVTFFNAKVDTSKRILKAKEVREDMNLVRRLLSA